MMVNINDKVFIQKPNSKQTAIIRKYMHPVELNLEKLRNSLCAGKTIQPAILDDEGNFVSQQVFFVDVDSSTVTETKKRAKKYNLWPNIIYRTFSGGNRHRVVFVLDEPITDLRERNDIMMILIQKFKGDTKPQALKSLFYGGTLSYMFNPFKYLKKEEVLRYGDV